LSESQFLWKKNRFTHHLESEYKGGSGAELASLSDIHVRDPGSNLSLDRTFSLSVCFRNEFKYVGQFHVTNIQNDEQIF
jgi:hypothetical protein